MATSTVIFILMSIASLTLAMCWLDNKYQWRLVDWCNGKVSNPFSQPTSSTQSSSDQQRTIEELRARIEVLERVVTEPAYELNQKINKL